MGRSGALPQPNTKLQIIFTKSVNLQLMESPALLLPQGERGMEKAASMNMVSRRILLALAALAVVGCAPSQPDPQITASLRRNLTDDEKKLISHAVAATLMDPDGGKFLWAPLILYSESGSGIYCGLVNGKNSYGAYIGYRKYAVKVTFGPNMEIRSAELRGLAQGDSDFSTGYVDGGCSKFGYGNLEGAQA